MFENRTTVEAKNNKKLAYRHVFVMFFFSFQNRDCAISARKTGKICSKSNSANKRKSTLKLFLSLIFVKLIFAMNKMYV